jgi:hypothetical protein
MIDITFTVNSYDQDGDVVEEGIFLHFGETRIRVANDIKDAEGLPALMQKIITEIKRITKMPFFDNYTGQILDGLHKGTWLTEPSASVIIPIDERARKIEFTAQAFIEATGLDPTDAMLVEYRDGDTIKWWFEKRTGDV